MTRANDTINTFEFYLRATGNPLPEPETEFRFHPKRRWRFDLAWPEQQVAVELDGGVWGRGRHVRAKGFEADHEKINAAIERGWVVLRYTPSMLSNNPGQVMSQIKRVLAARSEGARREAN